MPYRRKLQELIENKVVSGCIIFTSNGDIFWHTGTFPQSDNKFVDGYKLFSDWMTYPSETRIAGVKYLSLVNSYPNYWILKNMSGYGSLILQRNDILGYYFFCWIDNSQNPITIQPKIKIVADLFGA